MDIELDKEKERLLEIHANVRKAHFESDADSMVSSFASSVIRVAGGGVSQSSKEEMRQGFKGYFQNATYHEMDDLEEPIIRISQDGSMAWMIARTKVRFIYKNESGEEAEQAFIYAGIVTYEKQAGEWVRTANVVTTG